VAPAPRLSPFTRLLPVLVLLAMLGATALLWDHEREIARQNLRAQFDFALRDTVSRIEQRELAYEQMLRGLQGIMATTDLNDSDAIRRYVETLQLDANFSGIQGTGVIQWFDAAQRERHVETMRALGFPNYVVTPVGESEGYAPTIQNIPSIGKNRLQLGFDPWAEPVRRAALEKARDSGMPAITGKLRLSVDEGTQISPGFVMYLPLFAQGQPVDSVAQRRSALIGWVYAGFHMSDFMASLYGKQASGLSLSIYDGIAPVDSALMYRTASKADARSPRTSSTRRAALTASEYMVIGGHTWTLMLSTEKEFEDRFGRDLALVIAVAGISLSVSMALLVWFMVNGRAHALRLADEMTVELRHMAQHDHLTGLPNRALFSDRVQQTLAHARRHGGYVAMIFIDLDKFKPINDNHGHAVGDLLLQQVALRLREVTRVSDTVGRIGGDEFVVLMGELPETTIALKLAEKIRQLIAQPFVLNGLELSISCSIGVAFYPDDGENEESLIKSADKAMYHAKDCGRNSVYQAV
jgi:diguanylate cyclase (GGDEF)-like protein